MFKRRKQKYSYCSLSGCTYSSRPMRYSNGVACLEMPAKYAISVFDKDEQKIGEIQFLKPGEIAIGKIGVKFCCYMDAIAFYIEYDLLNKNQEIRITEVK